jgi:hypothetical protein
MSMPQNQPSNFKQNLSNFGTSAQKFASNTGTTVKNNPNMVAYALPLIIPLIFLILSLVSSHGLTLKDYNVLIIFSMVFSLLSIFWKGDILSLNTGVRIYWGLLGILGLAFSLFKIFFDSDTTKSQCLSYVDESDKEKKEICG